MADAEGNVVSLITSLTHAFGSLVLVPGTGVRIAHAHDLFLKVADKLGIDLVWFGVLLAINMQTSFMHPPFGFALEFARPLVYRAAASISGAVRGGTWRVSTM